VIGTLDAPDYALFVSHNHPDGQGHFNVFPTKSNKHWGMFTTDTEVPSEVPGPSYRESFSGTPVSASKIRSSNGVPWDTILLARLRFRPDAAEPTSSL
jgi:hypothetical protein